jgi:hypothetical protein
MLDRMNAEIDALRKILRQPGSNYGQRRHQGQEDGGERLDPEQ